MQRRDFLLSLAAVPLSEVVGRRSTVVGPGATDDGRLTTDDLLPGIWRVRLGTPERISPISTRRYPPAAAALGALPPAGGAPVRVSGEATERGYVVHLPLAPNEMVYGLGLQFQSFIQRGLKKKLRVNADPVVDSGDSHAPVPFYLTTRGYGVLIDTARYATVYAGNKPRKGEAAGEPGPDLTKQGLPESYARYDFQHPSEVMVEVPEARGVDVYLFAGPTMRLAAQRYNLFSGGGALPPRWALGVWYRCQRDFGQADVQALAAEFRERRIPCDVLGLEPGWQTHAYSCSYVWSEGFPDPRAMIADLGRSHYRLNLWEHAFVHPSSPIHDPLVPHSGDYLVWDGLVPDFLQPEARRIFGGFHEREHVALGVSGYKLDECDNSDFTRNWSFPELSRFPSGADGEQMHSLFGRRYQDTIQEIFERRGERTYGLVRSSGALAAPYPYVLYSDLYDHATFIRAVPKAGLSGLLWTPEVRDAGSPEELIRRLQSAILSPMALINAWYIRNPPWKQVERVANNEGRFAPGWEEVEARCREVLELRMRLVPYLHAAFVRYHREGIPPFRPLVMDHPDDVAAWPVDDEYMIGEALLAAPVTAGQTGRSVYLPEGEWFDFWSGRRYAGRRTVELTVPLEQTPLFARGGSLLPLAVPTLHTDDRKSGELTVRAYGRGDASLPLYEEDGAHDPELTEVVLAWSGARGEGSLRRSGPAREPGYRVVGWERVDGA
ncbi:MAG TPA: glycoside hydrolase family 31 protein [Longimicrobiaceae bacterium]|nr:glycoside hydrolase family 31 protein [Longimicrobiaceae bacterium]